MLTAYLDESGDSEQKRVFLLAGYLGYDDDWDRLWTQWARLLKTLGLPEFHAVDCEQGQGHFAGMSRPSRMAIQQQFVRLLSDAANGLIGHLSAIRLDAYGQLRPRFKNARRIPPGLAISGNLGDPYFLGLQLAVERIVRSDAVSALPPEEKVDFILDETTLGGRVGPLFDSLKGDKKLGTWTSRIGSVQLRSSAAYPPIQAADFWAYEAFRFSEQHFAGKTPEKRWQYSELQGRVDWRSAAYFDETGLRKVLDVLEGGLRDNSEAELPPSR